MDNLRRLVEALIFAADAPLSVDRLSVILEQPKSVLRPIIVELQQHYTSAAHGFYLAEVAGGYQFRTCAEFAPSLRKLNRSRASRFSRAALETLAIVAYRQPATRAEIEYLRGVDSGGVMKTLLDKNLLRILGKKDIPGRPLIYGTSRQFLELFGLRDLNDLPTLKEFSALAPELAEAYPLNPDPVD
ncbi:condensin subunit ScpB [Desulfuromusa kysingii]|uniref:Condensin subunit ScpB n=1 Tax=Desulfuromusa kysingii TaxID=37625 RepID=A0A1H4D097_9BACT|nr:SMC-Scp complex subunit ScpB [Desulfuromusa kysingii]SEA65752.1 condensin subunit ScpB [Desulfuromusa kysingii]